MAYGVGEGTNKRGAASKSQAEVSTMAIDASAMSQLPFYLICKRECPVFHPLCSLYLFQFQLRNLSSFYVHKNKLISVGLLVFCTLLHCVKCSPYLGILLFMSSIYQTVHKSYLMDFILFLDFKITVNH